MLYNLLAQPQTLANPLPLFSLRQSASLLRRFSLSLSSSRRQPATPCLPNHRGCDLSSSSHHPPATGRQCARSFVTSSIFAHQILSPAAPPQLQAPAPFSPSQAPSHLRPSCSTQIYSGSWLHDGGERDRGLRGGGEKASDASCGPRPRHPLLRHGTGPPPPRRRGPSRMPARSAPFLRLLEIRPRACIGRPPLPRRGTGHTRWPPSTSADAAPFRIRSSPRRRQVQKHIDSGASKQHFWDFVAAEFCSGSLPYPPGLAVLRHRARRHRPPHQGVGTIGETRMNMKKP